MPILPPYSRVSSPGFSLRIREAEKFQAYTPLASQLECRLVPFAFESFGTLGKHALKFLHDLSTYARESFSDWQASAVLSSLSILLQKGNADILSQGCLLVRSR